MIMPITLYTFPDFNKMYETFETKIEEKIHTEEKPICKTIALVTSSLFANNAQASFFRGDFRRTMEWDVDKSIHQAVERALLVSKGIFPNFVLLDDTAEKAEIFLNP